LQEDFKQFYLDDVLNLVLKYGSNTQYILAAAQTNFNNNLLLAEAEYCLENEMTNNTADFIIRRTGRLYFERPELNSCLDELDAFFTRQLDFPAITAIKFLKEFEKEYQSVVAFRD
ncbi:MAG TPA: glycerol-3-phosphate dehydrogenase C-terminal domain-containing protein, partial [Chitinophagales bacterium]|nr:glycerol-3-phosphate dehydrogenase C-terminal domain-containing protein [Chitinophagales bacterium]